MVKGVNRQIIEINDTGSRYFERVLLFVSPEGAELSSKELGSEAKEYLLHLTEGPQKNTLRSRIKRRTIRRRIILGSCLATVGLSVMLIVLNFL
jgi:hypothetical protein